jgi:GTP-binding protein EngB required for normal cell division
MEYIVVAILVILVIFIVFNSETDKEKPLTLLVCGATGAGKSTLINTILGAELANTGSGDPVTQNTERFHVVEKSLAFYDSRGLEVEDASKTYLLLLSDLLMLRFGCGDELKIDFVLMCILEPSNRIDEAHIEIASICVDMKIPYGIVLTKTTGNEEFAGIVGRKFGDASFVHQIHCKETKTRFGNIYPVGVDELVPRVKLSLSNVGGSCYVPNISLRQKTKNLSRCARELAASTDDADEKWIPFVRAAYGLLDEKKVPWSIAIARLKKDLKRKLVPEFFKRTLFTSFDDKKIEGVLCRRMISPVIKRFSDGSHNLSENDFGVIATEAISSLEFDRPFRSIF